MDDSRYYDEKYLNDRLSKLEGAVGGSVVNQDSRTKEQIENEQLKRENEMLKQRLQMAADPVRVEFEQSEEFRNAWLTNVVSYLYEANMAQWAQSPYAQRLDEWTQNRVEEIRQSRDRPSPQSAQAPAQAQPKGSAKNKPAQIPAAGQDDGGAPAEAT